MIPSLLQNSTVSSESNIVKHESSFKSNTTSPTNNILYPFTLFYKEFLQELLQELYVTLLNTEFKGFHSNYNDIEDKLNELNNFLFEWVRPKERVWIHDEWIFVIRV